MNLKSFDMEYMVMWFTQNNTLLNVYSRNDVHFIFPLQTFLHCKFNELHTFYTTAAQVYAAFTTFWQSSYFAIQRGDDNL